MAGNMSEMSIGGNPSGGIGKKKKKANESQQQLAQPGFNTGPPPQFGTEPPSQFDAGSPSQFDTGSPSQFGTGPPSQFGAGSPSQFDPAPPPIPIQSGMQIPCGRCNQVIIPCNDTYPSLGTHIAALCLFLLGLPFCIFLPYCCDCFGKPVKRCPNCGHFLQGGPLVR